MAISELYTPPSSNFSEQIWVQKCLLNKPHWRGNVEKNLFCTLIELLKLVIFHNYMNWKHQKSIQNAEVLTHVVQNWHNFFRSYEEMAENGRKQQESMSLSLTPETAVEYTIWPANDIYIITVIMPTLLLIGLTNIMGIQMLVPLGREKTVLYSEIAGVIVDVILNVLLIPRIR